MFFCHKGPFIYDVSIFLAILDPPPFPSRQQMSDFCGPPPPPWQHVSDFYAFPQQAMKFSILSETFIS